MAIILRYFTELVYDVVVKQLPHFQNLLLIVYDHIKTICAIIHRLFAQNKLITRSDGRRCIDDWLCAYIRPSIDIYSRNYEVGSMGVGAGLYMYDVIIKKCTFAISSPDEFLFYFGYISSLLFVRNWKACMFEMKFGSYNKKHNMSLSFCLFYSQICIYPYHCKLVKGQVKQIWDK